MSNPGTATQRLTISSEVYQDHPAQSFTLAPGERVRLEWPLDATGRWYDLSVHNPDQPAYLRRLAGRMENGLPSTSDPAMGGRSQIRQTPSTGS